LIHQLVRKPSGKITASVSYYGQWRVGFVVGMEFNNWRRARVQDNTTSWISRSPTFVSSRTLRRVYAMSAAVTGFVGLPASSWRASNIARSSESVSRL
jgi:SH3-like domain-containing protein